MDDDAVADEEHFEDMDLFVQHIKTVRRVENPKPIVVHCSAGIGRTGTLLAIYAILESIEKFEEKREHIQETLFDEGVMADYPNSKKARVSVFGAVRRMRE